MSRVRVLRAALLTAALLTPAPALAVKRGIIKELHSEYSGHSYQLRTDLRGTDYFAAFNVINDQGVQYRGRQMAILFYQMETVYLDRISSEGEREIRLSIYRNQNDARQIRGSVPAAPLPVGPDRASTLSNFARDLSTNVILEVRAGKDEPEAQRRQISELMDRLFYLKETPSFDQKEAFILTHPDLPLQRLMSITGFGEDMVRGILKKGESRQK